MKLYYHCGFERDPYLGGMMTEDHRNFLEAATEGLNGITRAELEELEELDDPELLSAELMFHHVLDERKLDIAVSELLQRLFAHLATQYCEHILLPRLESARSAKRDKLLGIEKLERLRREVSELEDEISRLTARAESLQKKQG